ncbi:hypothetical protein C5S39_12180 [Candidatus Methanophagaceae archaeon]|nr:hypothetical protein C5S39_12180 [Methanophagales archaeon]
MEPLSIGILVIVLLIVVEALVMLVKFKVDKTLLLMPIAGLICAIIAFVLNEYRDKILASLDGSVQNVVIYVLLAVGVLLGLVGLVVWFKGEKEAKKIIATAKGIDSAVAGIDSDLRGSEVELEHFDDEMGAIKEKVTDYESKDKEV